jgi:hypothetical protein
MKSLIDSLPGELFRLLLDEIQLQSPTIALVASLLFSDRLDGVTLRKREKYVQNPPSISLDFLASRVSGLSANTTNIDLDNLRINDDFIAALASSSAAPGLKHLRARGGSISDSSAHMWIQFSNLESLYLEKCPGWGPPSFRAISKLQHIRTLEAWSPFFAVDNLARIWLDKEALPELRSLKIGGRGIDDCAEGLVAAVHTMNNPQRMERIVLATFY